MNKKLAILFAIITGLLVGTLVLFFNRTIDFPTILLALKLVIPSSIIAFVCGYFMEKILKTAKVETTVISNEAQKQFVDDLLISPSQVLNEIEISEGNSSSDNKIENTLKE